MSSVTTIETLPDSRSKTPSIVTEKELPLPPKRRFWHVSWIWETLSLLLSISCITAVLTLLLFYNNKPIPTWRFLTLNTAISILAVVAKSALLVPVAEVISQQKWYWFWGDDARPLSDFQRHDAASRGPWGSFVLLLRPRTWHLVSVGALVTVLALGMEPALQQVQTYAVRTVESVAQASISRVANYTDLSQDGTESALPILGTSVRGAVYSGLYSSSSSDSNSDRISATCPTGNCTWPAYSSLEVCSECQNLTMQLTNLTEKSKYMWGWELNGTNRIDSTTFTMIMSSSADSQFAYRAMNVSLLLDFVTVFFPPGSLSRNIRPHAYECILYFCVKTYNRKMTNGSMSESIDPVSWPDTSSPPRLADLNKTGSAYIDPALVQNFGVQPLWYRDKYWTLHHPVPYSKAPEKFTINLLTLFYLRTWLQKLITGDISTDPDIAAAADDLTQTVYQQMTGTQHDYVYGQASRPAFMPGPAPLFKRLASTMTNYMLAQSQEKAIGSSYSNETYVRVRWAWGILPVTLVLLTALLLVATAVLSARRDMPTWKSSALPSLFHGLDDCQTVSLGVCQPERIVVMEKRADAVRARLCSEDGIVRLRAQRRNTCV